MIQFKEGARTYLLVELPDGAKDLSLVTNQSTVPYSQSLNYEDPISFRGYRNYCGVDLPQGNWTLHGKVKELTEEQAKGLVERVTVNDWKNYTDPSQYMDRSFKSTLESLASLLRKNGHDIDQVKDMLLLTCDNLKD